MSAVEFTFGLRAEPLELDDALIFSVVRPFPPGEHAVANARQLALWDAWERDSLRGAA